VLVDLDVAAPELPDARVVPGREPDPVRVVPAWLAEILEVDKKRVRVVAPDVGGGFGAKLIVYPEFAGFLDTLIVDEAGQVSLADACASSAVDRAPRKLERPSDHAPAVVELRLPSP